MDIDEHHLKKKCFDIGGIMLIDRSVYFVRGIGKENRIQIPLSLMKEIGSFRMSSDIKSIMVVLYKVDHLVMVHVFIIPSDVVDICKKQENLPITFKEIQI